MIESGQTGSHNNTILPLPQDSSVPTTPSKVPTWLTAASAVAHTVRITHIPNYNDIPHATALDTCRSNPDQLQNGHQQLPDSDTAPHASAYYDAEAMSPLNPFSKVSRCNSSTCKPAANPVSPSPYTSIPPRHTARSPPRCTICTVWGRLASPTRTPVLDSKTPLENLELGARQTCMHGPLPFSTVQRRDDGRCWGVYMCPCNASHRPSYLSALCQPRFPT